METREPGELLRLRSQAHIPGTTWLEMSVSAVSGLGSRYQQRAIFYPQGIVGRIYWYGARPLHRRWFSQTLRHIVAQACSNYT